MTTYRVRARNFWDDSENRIHSDDVAQKYGFTGALVPGAAVYGHLTHPLVERFGAEWLARSHNSVRFFKPAYHRDELSIELSLGEGPILVDCHNQQGELLATLQSKVLDQLPEPLVQPGENVEPVTDQRVTIEWDTLQVNVPFPEWKLTFNEEQNEAFVEAVRDELSVYQSGFVHPHWILSTANTALTRQFFMPAWLHVGSEITHRQPLREGDEVTVLAVPTEKWEKKGHQFLRLHLTFNRKSTLTTEILHTAIFKIAEHD